jgi:hypothetical protein
LERIAVRYLVKYFNMLHQCPKLVRALPASAARGSVAPSSDPVAGGEGQGIVESGAVERQFGLPQTHGGEARVISMTAPSFRRSACKLMAGSVFARAASSIKWLMVVAKCAA